MRRPDRALVGVEQVALQCVQRLALIELAGDLAPVRRGRTATGLATRPGPPAGNHHRAQRLENYNGVNDYILFGKSGELASNRREEQELSMLCLHILQSSLGFVTP
jgi:hypothetical protein